jgi:hypothetical protein
MTTPCIFAVGMDRLRVSDSKALCHRRTLIRAGTEPATTVADTASTRGNTRESALAPLGAQSNDIRGTVHTVAMP